MAMAPEKRRMNPSFSMPVFKWGCQQRFTFNPNSACQSPFHPVSDAENQPKMVEQRSVNDARNCRSGELTELCSSSFRKPPLLEKKTQRVEAGEDVRERLLIHIRVGKAMKERISSSAVGKGIVTVNGDKFVVEAEEELESAKQLNRSRIKAKTDSCRAIADENEDLRSNKRQSSSPLPENMQNSQMGKEMKERISAVAKEKGIVPVNGDKFLVGSQEELESAKQSNRSRIKARTDSCRAIANENEDLKSKRRWSSSPLPENMQNSRMGKEMRERIPAVAKEKRIVPVNGDKLAVAVQEELESANQLNCSRIKARTDSCRVVANENEDVRSKKCWSSSPLPENVQNSRKGKEMKGRISAVAKESGIVPVNGDKFAVAAQEELESAKQLNRSRIKSRTDSCRAVANENEDLRNKKRRSSSPSPENLQNSRVGKEMKVWISAVEKEKGIVPANGDRFAVAAEEELEAAKQLNGRHRARTDSCRFIANENEDLRSKKRQSPSPLPKNVQNSRWLRSSGIQMDEKETTLPKFSVSLSRQEIEEDFMAMTGAKPPLRPKKRPFKIQKKIHAIVPGQCLADVTPDSYRVRDDPEHKKR